jgi:tetratricopeptide (TPR) repeat protein
MPDNRNPIARSLANGRTLFDQGAYSAARAEFAAALEASPDSAEANARLAATEAKLADWPAAENAWRKVLATHPDLAVAQTGLGIALREQGRIPEAIAAFEQAIASHADLAAAHFNLGTCLLGCGRPAEAAHALKSALTRDPASGDIRFNLALALLQTGAFKTGALTYEARWKAEWRGQERPFSGPRWNGRELSSGQPLLLWGEQGIGDEIMFAGLVPAALRAAAGPVLIECAPRLVPLFARSFPGIRSLPRTTPPDPAIPPEGPHCPLGALPGLFWPSDTIPEAPAAYLRADRATTDRMREALAALGPSRKIGIAWRGGHPAAKRPRFIPPEAWRPLFAQKHSVLVCLQHDPDAVELDALTTLAGRPIHRLPGCDPLLDMDHFAALVSALDAVVSVDNSTVHLAGALGVPTAVLLAVDSDWRWGVDGVPCPWYRSVVRLRQKAPQDWSSPLGAALEFLAQTATRR